MERGRWCRVGDMNENSMDNGQTDAARREDAARTRTEERLARERRYDAAGAVPPCGLPPAADGGLASVRRISYGGTAGSFSEMAAKRMFPAAERVARRTFPEACDELEAGGCGAAVLPLRNTTGGAVDTVYRLLERGLSIARFTDLYVEHCLAALPGARTEDVRTVVSHPQAFAQCSKAIGLHGWRMEPADNTAFAPGIVRAAGDPSKAAICSREAAALNGLAVLAPNICDTPRSDITRFVAVTRGLIVTPDASRLSVLVHLAHRTGALADVLDVLADRGLNLSAIAARPVPEKPWEYSFFLDIEAPAMAPSALAALRQFGAELPMVRVVGWYGEG